MFSVGLYVVGSLDLFIIGNTLMIVFILVLSMVSPHFKTLPMMSRILTVAMIVLGTVCYLLAFVPCLFVLAYGLNATALVASLCLFVAGRLFFSAAGDLALTSKP